MMRTQELFSVSKLLVEKNLRQKRETCVQMAQTFYHTSTFFSLFAVFKIKKKHRFSFLLKNEKIIIEFSKAKY